MLLEEYRTKVIERLRSCRDTAAARHILAEADLVLVNSRLTSLTLDKFWETLLEDLDGLAEDARFMMDREAGAKLSAVVVAARARIARYRERIAGDQEKR
jgi:hypothetical protein